MTLVRDDTATRHRLADALHTLRRLPHEIDDPRALAKRVGVSVSALTALCTEHYHLSPTCLIDRARCAAAAKALAAGASIEHAGAQAGFAQATTYERRVRQHYGVDPRTYRALVTRPAIARGGDSFEMALPAGFVWGPLQHLMNRDPSGACERTTLTDKGLIVERGFTVDATACVLRVDVLASRVRVHIGRRDAGPIGADHRLQALTLTRRLLGLDSHIASLRARAASPQGAWFRPLLARHPGLRVPLMGNAYEALVWAVLGQQVNLRFAAQLRAELIRLAQPTPVDATTQLLPHPTPAQVARLDADTLHRRRFSRSKATWIISLSAAVASGALDLEALGVGPAAQAHAGLVAHKGIGDWTAQYVMLRGMGFNDCAPVADAGLMRHLQSAANLTSRPDHDEVARYLAPLAPARSLACQHLWAWHT